MKRLATWLAAYRHTPLPVQLMGCAGLSAILYLFGFTLTYPLLTNYATPLHDLGKLAGYSRDGAFSFMGSLTLLFFLYGLGYRIVRLCGADSRVRRVVLIAPFVFAVILLCAFPIGAIDVYDYAFHGKLFAFYHVSPITHVPAEFGGDDWIRYVAWPQATLPYGPVWVALSGIIYTAAGNDLLANLLGYKLVAAGSLLLDATLVYLILRRWRPHDALLGFFFVAWNPLLLTEMAANAHNDALMVTFILLSLYLFQRQHIVVALVALVIAALVKLPAMIILPIMLIVALRQQTNWRACLRFLASAGLAILATVILLYGPFWDGAELLARILPRQDLYTTSLPTLGVIWLRPAIGDALARSMMRTETLIIFAGAMALLWLKLDDTFESLARATLSGLLLLLLIATIWFQPWYLAWIVPLAPLAGNNNRSLAALFSWSALWDYFIFDFAWYWNPSFFNQADGLILNLSAVLLIFVPPIALVVAQALGKLIAPKTQRMGSIQQQTGVHQQQLSAD